MEEKLYRYKFGDIEIESNVIQEDLEPGYVYTPTKLSDEETFERFKRKRYWEYGGYEAYNQKLTDSVTEILNRGW